MEKLIIHDLFKQYNKRIIFNNLNIEFTSEKLNIIDGSNGSGKTTLLNIIGNIDLDYKGEIYDEKCIFITTADCEFYLQNNNLFEYLTVFENLKLINDDENLILSLLEESELTYLKDKTINTLSKGEKQRISIIKSIISKKNILLFDEPFSNIDYQNKILFIELIKKYTHNKIVIIATNNIENELLKDVNVYKFPLKSTNSAKINTIKNKKNKIKNTNYVFILKSILFFIKKNIINYLFLIIINVFFIILTFVSSNFYLNPNQEFYKSAKKNHINTFFMHNDEINNYYHFTEDEFSFNDFYVNYIFCFGKNDTFKIQKKEYILKDNEIIVPKIFQKLYNINLNDEVLINENKYIVKNYYQDESINSYNYYQQFSDINKSLKYNFPILTPTFYLKDKIKDSDLHIISQDLVTTFLNSYFPDINPIQKVNLRLNTSLKNNNTYINKTYKYDSIHKGINLSNIYKEYYIQDIKGTNIIFPYELNLYASKDVFQEIKNNVFEFNVETNEQYMYFIDDSNYNSIKEITYINTFPSVINYATWNYIYSYKLPILIIDLFIIVLEIIALILVFTNYKQKIRPILNTMYFNDINIFTRFIIFIIPSLIINIISIILSLLPLYLIKAIKTNDIFNLIFISFKTNFISFFNVFIILSLLSLIISYSISRISKKSLLKEIRLDNKNV